jgi:hypothetical protein
MDDNMSICKYVKLGNLAWLFNKGEWYKWILNG